MRQATKPARHSGGRSRISKADQRINELLQDSRNNNASPNFSVLSQRTVESHVHRFLRKLNISNRTELSMAVA